MRDTLPHSSGLVGDIIMSAATSRAGCLLCDGSSQLRAAYPVLFAAIGTAFGSVDGTHFNLPDMRGYVPMGAGSGGSLTPRSLGTAVGEEQHTLVTGEMPPHAHSVTDTSVLTASGASTWDIANAGGGRPSRLFQPVTDSQGGGGAHNNVQPSLPLNFFIKAF